MLQANAHCLSYQSKSFRHTCAMYGWKSHCKWCGASERRKCKHSQNTSRHTRATTSVYCAYIRLQKNLNAYEHYYNKYANHEVEHKHLYIMDNTQSKYFQLKQGLQNFCFEVSVLAPRLQLSFLLV